MSGRNFRPLASGIYGCPHALATDDGQLMPCIWTRGGHIGHDAWAAPDSGDKIHWCAWDNGNDPLAYHSPGAVVRVERVRGVR